MKSTLRQRLTAIRREVDPSARQQAAEQAAVLLSGSEIFQQSQNIACYMARKEEFDCMPIIKLIWGAKKHCYLPVVASKQDEELSFVSYTEQDELALNRYRILEPVNTQPIAVENLDLVIVPLVGFDLAGNRLGMGGGYYDRTFAFLRDKPRKKPLFIGLGYDKQQVNELPCDSWDVQLDGALTNKDFFWMQD